MKSTHVASMILAAAALIPASASAQITGGVRVQVNAPPPPGVVVTVPQPQVYAPQPQVYVAPQPQVVVQQPQPTYYAPENEPEVDAMMAPPPVQAEAIPPAPAPGFVWQAGYWRWNGAQYMWIGGHWQQPPQAGYVWQQPRWVVRHGRWRFARAARGGGKAEVYAPQPQV